MVYRSSPAQLANLKPGWKGSLKPPEEKRSAYMTARLTNETKENLLEMLKQMGLTLGDLLELITTGEILVIPQSDATVKKTKKKIKIHH